MEEKLFGTSQVIKAQAMFVGQRLDLRAFKNTDSLADVPLTVKAGSNGVAILFRYGVVVFFGLGSTEIISFLEDIQSLIVERFSEVESDAVEIFLQADESEGLDKSRIRLREFTLQRLQIIADVLAKSVVLAHYEIGLAANFDRIEPLAADLALTRRPGRKGKDLLQHIGDILLIESKMIGRVEIAEKPELIWDFPEHERLYLRLEDEYELSERHSAVDRKLALISKTAETLLSLLQNQRSLRVEWYIVILIVVEIVIMLWEMGV